MICFLCKIVKLMNLYEMIVLTFRTCYNGLLFLLVLSFIFIKGCLCLQKTTNYFVLLSKITVSWPKIYD